MANEINISLGQTGLSVTGIVYLDGVLTGNTIALTEVVGSGGLYVGNMPALSANVYEILFYANLIFRGAGAIDWTGSAEATVSSRLASSAYTAPDNAGTATLLSRLSSGRAALLDNLDAAISSRSTLDASGVWSNGTRTLTSFGTLVADVGTAIWSAGARTLTAFGFNVTVATNNDKTGYSLTAGEHTSVQADADAALQAKGYTSARATKLDGLDVAVSSRNSTAHFDSIIGTPVGLSLSADIAEIEGETDGIASIPTNPLLTTDSRLDYLDATVSSRSTLTAAQVWAYGTRTLSSFGTLVVDIWANSLRTLTSFGFSVAGPILVASPVQVDAGRTIKMARGADYTANSGQPAQFRFSGMSSFAGGSCVLTLPRADGTAEVINGSIVGTDTAQFDVTRTITPLLADGRYSVQVTLANGSVLIPVIGPVLMYQR
jgi:hypothetical protein